MSKTATHPAPFSEPILRVLDRLVRAEHKRLGRRIEVLDPFAGVGRIHQLARPGLVDTYGIDIEPEWAAMHERTVVGDALDIGATHGRRRRFDVVATSPTYGNRFADHHTPKDASTRHSYAFSLGRMPTEGSSAVMPWGPAYWRFHALFLNEAHRVLHPGGLLLYNVSNFVRHKAEVHAVEWHLGVAYGAGFRQWGQARPIAVPTARMRHGANHAARVEVEYVLRLRKGDPA